MKNSMIIAALILSFQASAELKECPFQGTTVEQCQRAGGELYEFAGVYEYAALCNGGDYAMCAVIDGPKNPAGPVVKKAAPAADVQTQDN